MKLKNWLLVIVLTLVVGDSGSLVKGAGLTASPTIAGAALIKGVVKFAGTAPAPKPISMSADPSCAKQHPGPVLSREVVTDPRGGLQNVVVFVADGLGDRTFDPPKQPVVIEQKGCQYQPHVLVV
ncbi:MAG TPA: hypothetical protein VGV15_11555, partial [Terriglobales bacterium]|nr:hypothetical protein [Terriglobales bacterium]